MEYPLNISYLQDLGLLTKRCVLMLAGTGGCRILSEINQEACEEIVVKHFISVLFDNAECSIATQ